MSNSDPLNVTYDAAPLLEALRQRGQTVATVESCTGGLIAGTLTAVAGSSDVFGYGFVTYSNEAKTRLVQVSPALLETWGAVSPQTAQAMVQGLLNASQADWGIAVTGIAGPGGGSPEKPVGLVYIACGNRNCIQVCRCQFPGNRDQVRRQTVAAALSMLADLLAGEEGASFKVR